MRTIKWIVLHCTAGPQTQTVASIKRYWKEKLGWTKNGYHHLISPDGTDNFITPIEEISNGVAGYNTNSIHISYIGGVDSTGRAIDNRTDAQKTTQKKLVEKYMKQFPSALVMGHRDFSPDKNRDGIILPNEWIKTCPSFEVKTWLKESGLISNPEMPIVKKVTTSGGSLNVRTGPGILFDVKTSIANGAVCMIMKTECDWSLIAVNGKELGYVKTEYLK